MTLPTAPPPTSLRPQASLKRDAIVCLALLVLNSALSFSTWWPTPGIVPEARLAPEFVWLWVLLLVWVAWRGRLSVAGAAGLAVAYLVLVLGRYIDVTAPALFGREVKLYWDLPQLPRFLWVTAQALPWWWSALAVLAVLAVTGLLVGLLFGCIRVAARDAVPVTLRKPWLLGLTAVAVVLTLANHAGVRATWPLVSKPVVPMYWQQAKLLYQSWRVALGAEVLPPKTAIDDALARTDGRALAALGGRDLYLIPLESYGAIAYDDPRAAHELAPLRQQLADSIAASGRFVVSGFMRSPTFGGGSDLAQLGVLAAMDLSNPTHHDLLLTTARPTLMAVARASGYQSMGVYFSLRWPWPEAAFYGYDEVIEGRDFAYPGPELGYWLIPDQYALARFEQLRPRTPNAPPRLVFMPTITCHLPFSPVPPYQPDWQQLLSKQPYPPALVAPALAEQPRWANMFPDYLRMLAYTYRWLAGYLVQPEPRSTVYVLFGDHQPAASVTGQGASWDVPVHIVADDRRLLAGFEARGFQPGLEPSRALLGDLHQLTEVMLQVFAGAPAMPAVAHAARGKP